MQDYTGCSYDNIHFIPQYSEVKSRDNVSVVVQLPKGHIVSSCITPANMPYQTYELLRECLKQWSLVILHRFTSLDEQIDLYKKLRKEFPGGKIGVSVGVRPEDYENVDCWVKDYNVDIVCLEIAHAHCKVAGVMVQSISSKYPRVLLIAGNVSTYEGTLFLLEKGADIVKIGQANGSQCTTRYATGIYSPQFQAINDAYGALQDYMFSKPHMGPHAKALIADGGIKHPCDVSKALCRAQLAMSGSLFSSTYEACGSWETPITYRGSSTFKNKYVEGKEEIVFAKETVECLYNRVHDGIRSTCSYLGKSSIEELEGWDKFTIVK